MKPVVLVTGGSRGIGAATAWLAAQQGWAVAVNYTQDAAAAQAVVARIQDAGGLALAVQADVGNEAQVMAMFAQIDQALPAWEGRWAGLVNSAGVVDQAQRVEARRASSSRIYSGARPPLKKMPAYSSGLMSLKAISALIV